MSRNHKEEIECVQWWTRHGHGGVTVRTCRHGRSLLLVRGRCGAVAQAVTFFGGKHRERAKDAAELLNASCARDDVTTP